MIENYSQAYKAAQKAYKTAISQGRSPYLPVLDDILTHAHIDYDQNLGISEIALDKIVGTCTVGRTQAFANNFMPLLPDRTEFSSKWNALLEAQINEGIHDPVKVYEFMNRYYVLEGNKRVSVMKALENPFITAEVIRKVPHRTNEPDILLYYEYMAFHKTTGISYVELTHLGAYDMLTENLKGGLPNETFDEDFLHDFNSMYSIFHQCFKKRGGDHLENVTCGDALLYYLNLFPYAQTKDSIKREIDVNMEQIWPDIILLGSSDKVEISLKPAEGSATLTSTVKNFLLINQKKLAFVYDKDPEDSDWIYSHELGRLHLEESMADSVMTCAFIAPDINEGADALMESICAQGFDVVFTVTPRLIKATLKASVTHPEVIFLNCSPKTSHKTIRTYYNRIYEAKFLSGMIAGALCENDRIGYVEDYPLYGIAANINAFALGAKMVNPRAKVYLAWSTTKNSDPWGMFWDNQINYISVQDMAAPQNHDKRYGLYTVKDGVITNLAMPLSNWGEFYEKIVVSILKGLWKKEEENADSKALNYWWGFSAGCLDVIYSQKLPAELVRLVELMKDNLTYNTFQPFTGPLKDQSGVLRAESGVALTPDQILTMDYLLDNVIGSIPKIEDLEENAQEVVRLRGINSYNPLEGGAAGK